MTCGAGVLYTQIRVRGKGANADVLWRLPGGSAWKSGADAALRRTAAWYCWLQTGFRPTTAQLQDAFRFDFTPTAGKTVVCFTLGVDQRAPVRTPSHAAYCRRTRWRRAAGGGLVPVESDADVRRIRGGRWIATSDLFSVDPTDLDFHAHLRQNGLLPEVATRRQVRHDVRSLHPGVTGYKTVDRRLERILKYIRPVIASGSYLRKGLGRERKKLASGGIHGWAGFHHAPCLLLRRSQGHQGRATSRSRRRRSCSSRAYCAGM